MTLTLHLPPELEQRLRQEAKRQGLLLDAYTLQLLDKHLPPKDQRTELVTCSRYGSLKVTPKNNERQGSTSCVPWMRIGSLTGSCSRQS